VLHPLETALLEGCVADCQSLVHKEDVRLEVGCDAEAEAHLHARGVVLHLAIDGALEARELDDLVESARDLLPLQAHERPREEDVLPSRQKWGEPCADLDQRADSTGDRNISRGRIHDPGEDLEKSRLAGAILAHQRPRLAGLCPEIDVAKNPPPGVAVLATDIIREPAQLVLEICGTVVDPEALPDLRRRDGSVTQGRQVPFRGA
jgi:hypothetical protein